jgi:hypothetical protein
VDRHNLGTRSYRVSSGKIEQALGFAPKFYLAHSVKDSIQKILESGIQDFQNPIYYNIRWMTRQEEKSGKPL